MLFQPLSKNPTIPNCSWYCFVGSCSLNFCFCVCMEENVSSVSIVWNLHFWWDDFTGQLAKAGWDQQSLKIYLWIFLNFSVITSLVLRLQQLFSFCIFQKLVLDFRAVVTSEELKNNPDVLFRGRFWIIQPCFIVPPSSLCFSLFVFQRTVFELGGVLSLNLYFSVDHRNSPFVLCVGGVGGSKMLVAGRLGEWGRDPGLGDGIWWNSREMRP